MFNLKNIYISLVAISLSFLVITIGTFICLIYFDFVPTKKFDYAIVLLPPIGILLSAFLASVSVLKNIENTNRIEKEKKEKEEKQFLNKMKIYIAEVEYFVKLFKHTFSDYEKETDIEKKETTLIYQKSLNHSKNLIIKDINFIEHLESDEYELIRLINSIEIIIDIILQKEYDKDFIKLLNENVDSLEEEINRIKTKRK